MPTTKRLELAEKHINCTSGQWSTVFCADESYIQPAVVLAIWGPPCRIF